MLASREMESSSHGVVPQLKPSQERGEGCVNTPTGSVSVADSQSNTVTPEGWKLRRGGCVNTQTGSVGVADPQSNTVTPEGWKVGEASVPDGWKSEDITTNVLVGGEVIDIEKVNELGEYEISKDIPKESSNIKSYKKSLLATKKSNKTENQIKTTKFKE